MVIEVEKLASLTKDADKIFLTPEGEQVLVDLLEIKAQVEAAIDEAEKRLEEAALQLDPEFKSIQADRIKVYYRAFGSTYKIDDSLADQIPAELYTVKKSYAPNVAAINEWTKEHGGMPIGIIEPERPKQLKFKLKAVQDDEE